MQDQNESSRDNAENTIEVTEMAPAAPQSKRTDASSFLKDPVVATKTRALSAKAGEHRATRAAALSQWAAERATTAGNAQIKVLTDLGKSHCPRKSSVGLLVAYPPRGSTPPHCHAGASVSTFVIEGTVLNKMRNEPTQVFEQGGSWFEALGCHHRVSDNYSATESAKLLATLIVDTEVVEKGEIAALVVYDEEYRDISHKD
jgi:quercetin dioxygenase-like cupin family protein